MARLAHRARPPILGSLCLLGAVVSLGPTPHQQPLELEPMGPRPVVIVPGMPGTGPGGPLSSAPCLGPSASDATKLDPFMVICPPAIDPWMVITPPVVDPEIAIRPSLDPLQLPGPIGVPIRPLIGPVDDVLSGFLRTLTTVAPHPA